MDYEEFALAMCENSYVGVKEGLTYGDIREQQKFKAYRLSRDKSMLDYLYAYRDRIEFVIYVYWGGIEIIKFRKYTGAKKIIAMEF